MSEADIQLYMDLYEKLNNKKKQIEILRNPRRLIYFSVKILIEEEKDKFTEILIADNLNLHKNDVCDAMVDMVARFIDITRIVDGSVTGVIIEMINSDGDILRTDTIEEDVLDQVLEMENATLEMDKKDDNEDNEDEIDKEDDSEENENEIFFESETDDEEDENEIFFENDDEEERIRKERAFHEFIKQLCIISEYTPKQKEKTDKKPKVLVLEDYKTKKIEVAK